MKINEEKLHTQVYLYSVFNLLPFSSSPFLNPKTKQSTYLFVVYVEIIFIAVYFGIFIA